MQTVRHENACGFLETRLARRLISALLLCAASSQAPAAVAFTATNLADTTPGEDLWHYSYTVGGPLPLFNAVNLLFSPTLYRDIAVTASSAGVLALETQPDPALPADGQLTVTAVIDILAGGSETVDLDFVWLGTGTPGEQAYEVLDDQFTVIASGQTRLAGSVQGTPEPGTLGLLAFGLFALPALRSRSRCRVTRQ